MTLPASGIITMSDIKTEFGGVNPVSLADYYGVGTGPYAPASGEISFDDFYGLGNNQFITVTEGVTGPHEFQTYYGFSDGTYCPVAIGSIDNSTFEDATVREVYRRTGGITVFIIVLSGNRAQSFFTSLDIEGHGNVITATAFFYTYDGAEDVSYWAWDIDPTGWDGSGTRTVDINK